MGPHKLYVSSYEGGVWTDKESSFVIANVATHFLELNRGRQFDLDSRIIGPRRGCLLYRRYQCRHSRFYASQVVNLQVFRSRRTSFKVLNDIRDFIAEVAPKPQSLLGPELCKL